ncbi:MAG: DciA family protein [Dethiobacteria bacterium]|jgi:hypothetical protein
MDKLAKPLQSLLKKYGLGEQLEKRHYLRMWPAVVGRQVAAYTRPVNISRQKLTVEVNDSTWLYHLTLLKHKIITDFNTFAAAEILQEIKFINADFKSGLQQQEKTKQRTFYVEKPKTGRIQLKKEEEKELEKIVQQAPEFLKARLQKLYKNYYLQQKGKAIAGALPCQRCQRLTFTLQAGFCELCWHDLESWAPVLQVFFRQSPWGKYHEIHSKHPLLDEKIFELYKKRQIDNSAQQITAFLEENMPLDSRKEESLKGLVQNYILLVAAKEPPCIKQEDIFKALKGFPGLYQYLYS